MHVVGENASYCLYNSGRAVGGMQYCTASALVVAKVAVYTDSELAGLILVGMGAW